MSTGLGLSHWILLAAVLVVGASAILLVIAASARVRRLAIAGLVRGLDLGRAQRARLRLSGQVLLVGWFGWWAYQVLSTLVRHHVPIGQDIRIYYRAVQLWLAGGNPWAASIHVGRSTFSYAGSPATTVVLAPSALLPETAFAVLWVLLNAAGAVIIVRRLRLPLWWLLFPPLLEAVYSANPQLVVLALLLLGTTRLGVIADTIAVALKVYAGIPLVAERSFRRLLAAATFTVLTFAVAPGLWQQYLSLFGQISSRLATESARGYSAYYFPLLLVPTALLLAVLWLRDRRAAVWLAVPALWPASEFHYSTFALPVMSPILAILLAVPIQRLPPVAIMIDIVWRLTAPTLGRRAVRWLEQHREPPLGDALTPAPASRDQAPRA